MVEGVSSFTAISSLTGKMSGRSGEPDCQKQATQMTAYQPVESGQDNVSLNRQEAPPLTDARLLKNGQFLDCAFPVLRQLVSRIVQDQHTAGRINDGALEAVVMDKALVGEGASVPPGPMSRCRPTPFSISTRAPAWPCTIAFGTPVVPDE